jgi:ribose 5-phosphate isomerase A
MKLGLGTGTTAAIFVELLGAKVRAGLDIVCVPTSEATRIQAERLGIRLTTLDADPILDLVVDGADEIDVELQLIKGGGGALLREKIVASASNRMVVIADVSKKVAKLGRYPLPIEVDPFGVKSTIGHIEALAGDAGCTGRIALRVLASGSPFVTESGNFIVDCAFREIDDPESLAEALQVIPGVVEHGLFLGLADMAIVAGSGGIEVLHAKQPADD